MAAVPIIISPCVIADKYGRTFEVAAIFGMASLAGLGVGGGPIYPPEGGQPPGIWGGSNEPFPGYGLPGQPPGIWGGGNEGFPTHPGPLPPTGIWPSPGRPTHPIVLPPENLPPNMKPPEPPPAGTVTPVPPPEGSDGWPVQPVVSPNYVVFNYPGYGPVYVAKPAAPPAPTPTGRRG